MSSGPRGEPLGHGQRHHSGAAGFEQTLERLGIARERSSFASDEPVELAALRAAALAEIAGCRTEAELESVRVKLLWSSRPAPR